MFIAHTVLARGFKKTDFDEKYGIFMEWLFNKD